MTAEHLLQLLNDHATHIAIDTTGKGLAVADYLEDHGLTVTRVTGYGASTPAVAAPPTPAQ